MPGLRKMGQTQPARQPTPPVNPAPGARLRASLNEFGRKAGAFGHNGAARFAEILDGLSQTIAVGSKQGVARRQTRASRQRPVLGHGFARLLLWAINALRNGFHREGQFSSHPPGGAQFVMCDGSARFIKETVAFETVFVYLNRIQDGKAVPEY